MNIEEVLSTTHRISPRERVPFHCTCCGECCRHVRQSVPLESPDVFRLAVISDTGNEWIDPAGSWFCRMDHTPILFQKNAGVVNTCNFQHEHEIPTFVQ